MTNLHFQRHFGLCVLTEYQFVTEDTIVCSILQNTHSLSALHCQPMCSVPSTHVCDEACVCVRARSMCACKCVCVCDSRPNILHAVTAVTCSAQHLNRSNWYLRNFRGRFEGIYYENGHFFRIQVLELEYLRRFHRFKQIAAVATNSKSKMSIIFRPNTFGTTTISSTLSVNSLH